MITWMQRHKKWLIITVWVSTIAFVGAGFVGWGSYDYGKSSGTVATVNGKEVPFSDLQNEYSSLYSQYQRMFGENFNQELAKQLKLEDAAFQRVLQKHVILTYADELGLAVTDEEVARELVKIPSFFKDGKFDKNTYLSALKQGRKSAGEFEAQLKQDLLVQKVQKIYSSKLLDKEVENISTLLYAQDRVSVKVLDAKDIKVSLDEKMIKEHWEKTKDNYKSPRGYKISYTKIDNIEGKTKKEMKKVALKEYLNAKKGKVELAKTKTIFENSEFFDSEGMEKISKASDNKVLKPIYKNNNYYVVKVLTKVAPETLTYMEVKSQVVNELRGIKTNELLEAKAKKAMESFKGEDIGFISRESKPTIKGLDENEAVQLVQKIFASTNQIDAVTVGDKSVVFKITDTKLGTYDAKNNETVRSIVGDLKSNTVFNGLITQLEKRYEIKSFMENK